MSIFSEKVKKVLDSKGISQSELARRMGTTRQNIASIMRQEKPRLDTVEKVAAALEISTMELLSTEEIYGKFKDEINYVQSIPKRIKLPYLSIPVIASFVENFDCNPEASLSESYEFYPEPGERFGEGSMIVEIFGASMEPRLYTGYKVLATKKDPNDWVFLNPGIYAVMYHKTFTVKRIRKNTLREGYLELYADNEVYGMETVYHKDIRCIWKISKIVNGKLD